MTFWAYTALLSTVLHMKTQSNQDFHDFVYSLFPKAILFYFSFMLL